MKIRKNKHNQQGYVARLTFDDYSENNGETPRENDVKNIKGNGNKLVRDNKVIPINNKIKSNGKTPKENYVKNIKDNENKLVRDNKVIPINNKIKSKATDGPP